MGELNFGKLLLQDVKAVAKMSPAEWNVSGASPDVTARTKVATNNGGRATLKNFRRAFVSIQRGSNAFEIGRNEHHCDRSCQSRSPFSIQQCRLRERVTEGSGGGELSTTGTNPARLILCLARCSSDTCHPRHLAGFE
ncbi:hypothetical protein KM043_005069 [Ampulex compressa]|nr:hypothetical protein KM043_005069 [Ampulex compressa]